MRFIKILLLAGIILFLPIGFAAYGANEISNAEKLDIAEMVFRHFFKNFKQFKGNKHQLDVAIFCVKPLINLDDEYIDKFIDRFKSSNIPVRKYMGSSFDKREICTDGIIGRRVFLEMRGIEMRRDDEALVRVWDGRYESGCAPAYNYIVKRFSGVWKIATDVHESAVCGGDD